MPGAGTKETKSDHKGVFITSHKNVTIGGEEALTIGDAHRCPEHVPCSPIYLASETVTIGSLQAARFGDEVLCTAKLLAPVQKKVVIGGAKVPQFNRMKQNCYGLAVGIVKKLRVGGIADVPPMSEKALNADEVRWRVSADLDSLPLEDPSAPSPPGLHKIMFFSFPPWDPKAPGARKADGKPNWDYHVYREGSDGLWYHQTGQYPVTRVDSNCQPITDPRTAARAAIEGYDQFQLGDIFDDHRPVGQVVKHSDKYFYSDYVGTWLVPDDPSLIGKLP